MMGEHTSQNIFRKWAWPRIHAAGFAQLWLRDLRSGIRLAI
jgi:hypothetical protein